MARRKIDDAVALVTGASSGIGREIVLELARRGAHQVITARRKERLDELSAQVEELGAKVHSVVGDVVEPSVREQLLDCVRENFGRLDILVNNAGVGAIGPFADADEKRLRRVMEVNFFAPAELTRSALPLLREAQRPIVANIASVLGHRAVPKKSEYCASKFALHGWSDALRAELSKEKIDVLLSCPSTTKSEFFDNVLEDKASLPWRKFGAASSKSVARKTVRAIARGKHEIIMTPGGKMLVWLDRLCPRLTNYLVAKFG